MISRVLATAMRPLHVLVVGAGLTAVIVAVVLFSPQGLARLTRMRGEERALAGQVAQKQSENERMVEETRLLRGDSDASRLMLEKKAREELGYTAPGEIVVNLPAENAPVAAGAKDAGASR